MPVLMVDETIWILFIPYILSQLYLSFITPTNAPLIYIYANTVLYRCYMFRHHLRYPQAALRQDLKLNKIQYIVKVTPIILLYSCS